MNGHITVTTAGVRVQGTTTAGTVFAVKAHPNNTDVVYVGDSGVSSANGFPLSAGEGVVVQVSNLDKLWFDAAANGLIVCWIRVE